MLQEYFELIVEEMFKTLLHGVFFKSFSMEVLGIKNNPAFTLIKGIIRAEYIFHALGRKQKRK